jgi:hypothetical protein
VSRGLSERSSCKHEEAGGWERGRRVQKDGNTGGREKSIEIKEGDGGALDIGVIIEGELVKFRAFKFMVKEDDGKFIYEGGIGVVVWEFEVLVKV